MKVQQLTQNLMPLKQLEGSKKAVHPLDPKLEKSARDLEGLFLTFVLKAMEKTIPKEHSGSNNMATMMFSTVLGQSIADQGGIGMAKFFYNSLSQSNSEQIENLKDSINDPTIYNISTARTEK